MGQDLDHEGAVNGVFITNLSPLKSRESATEPLVSARAAQRRRQGVRTVPVLDAVQVALDGGMAATQAQELHQKGMEHFLTHREQSTQAVPRCRPG
jgi:hypothetical protein